jgi:hypothetical protein
MVRSQMEASVSVKARIYLDGEEVDLMEFSDMSEVQPGEDIELPDSRGILSGTMSGTRVRVKSVTATSDPEVGDTLVDVEVEPLPPN